MKPSIVRIAAAAGAVLILAGIVLSAVWYFGLAQGVERRAFPEVISMELADAPPGKTKAMRVRAWIRLHRADVLAAEQRFGIDRRAIAGLIAYEALVNVHVSDYAGLVRWAGPGKVHFKQWPIAEGNSVAKQVEGLGLLPKRTMEARRQILQSPRWACLYIAAIMRALSDVVRHDTGQDIRCEPGALATLASAWDVSQAQRHFALSLPGRRIVYNFPGNWVAAHGSWLADAVGTPAASLCMHT